MEWRLLVADELWRARKKFPPINSVHEGYAVIREELDEFWELVRRKPEFGLCVEALNELRVAELVQVAAMCQRTAEDVLHVDH